MKRGDLIVTLLDGSRHHFGGISAVEAGEWGDWLFDPENYYFENNNITDEVLDSLLSLNHRVILAIEWVAY